MRGPRQIGCTISALRIPAVQAPQFCEWCSQHRGRAYLTTLDAPYLPPFLLSLSNIKLQFRVAYFCVAQLFGCGRGAKEGGEQATALL